MTLRQGQTLQQCLSSVIDQNDMLVTDVLTTWVEVKFRAKVILYRQWMVFMSLVIDLIG